MTNIDKNYKTIILINLEISQSCKILVLMYNHWKFFENLVIWYRVLEDVANFGIQKLDEKPWPEKFSNQLIMLFK